MNSRRASVAWLAALVVLIAGLVSTVGVNAAQADDPTPSALPTDSTTDPATGTATATPDADPSDGPTTPTGTPSKAIDASDIPSVPTISADPTITPPPLKCPKCPADNYVPPDRTWFNHPFERAHDGALQTAGAIRAMVTRTVRSVPSGGSIKLAEFSLNDDVLVDSLIAAWKRGVTVQVVVNNHNWTGSNKTLGKSKAFIRLAKTIGTLRYNQGNGERASFARWCSYSCRGTRGNVHYKLFLFSSVGKTNYDPTTGVELPMCGVGQVNTPTVPCTTSTVGRDVTMMGSPNLTLKAAYGQWNHLDTYSNAPTYAYYSTWFAQMRADVPLKHPYERATTGAVDSWTFPKPGTTAKTDPLMQGLNGVRCTGATGGSGGSGSYAGRTKIRIGAYTFYQARGMWLAKKVRQLWNAGCDVAIEYSITSNPVKKVLYSPSGRGRIPMRQVVTFYRNGTINAYDHSKYIAISGHYGNDTSAWITFTGTNNISDQGFSSDDSVQVWRDQTRTNAYMSDFYRNWRTKYAHVPSPTSRLKMSKVTFGKGKYRNLEKN